LTVAAFVRRLRLDEQARFPHVPPVDRGHVRVVVLPVLTPGVVGITLGRWVLIRRGHEHDDALLGHELVHVRQWRELHAPVFLARYLAAYVRGRVRGASHWDAYAANPFEVEARELSGR
jgi:hypothetical protein